MTTATIASPSLRVRALGKLHAKKRELALDDDTYRDMLEARTGKRSAADLSDSEIAAVLDHLDGRYERQGRAKPLIPASPQGRMLQGLWMSLYNLGLIDDKSDRALVAFIKRQTHLGDAHWLRSHTDIEKVAEALKSWLAREGGVEWRPRRGDMPHMRFPSFRVCEAQWALLCRIDAQPCENLSIFAARVHGGRAPGPEQFTNAHWGHVSRKLGHVLRQQPALMAGRRA